MLGGEEDEGATGRLAAYGCISKLGSHNSPWLAQKFVGYLWKTAQGHVLVSGANSLWLFVDTYHTAKKNEARLKGTPRCTVEAVSCTDGPPRTKTSV